MATTTHVPGHAHGRGTDESVHGSVPFASLCPRCRVQQFQQGFSRAALGRLLKGGYPIEGYCATCDEFWTISPRERLALARALGSTK